MTRKTTDQLEQGDIVLYHGMRILLDNPPRVSEINGIEMYAWDGLVLNADELCDPASPVYNTHLYKLLRGVWWEVSWPHRRRDQWTVQGNSMALWSTGAPWHEEGTLDEDAGDLGGDIQSGKAYSRRFTHTKLPGRLFTVYAYPVTGDGTDDQCPKGVIRLQQQAELLICRDITEPGGTEAWSEYTYDDLPEWFEGDYITVGSAENAARLLVTSFDPDRFLNWDGKPDFEI